MSAEAAPRAVALFRDEARHYSTHARRLLFLHDDPQAAASYAFSAAVALRLMRRELGLPQVKVSSEALAAFGRAKRRARYAADIARPSVFPPSGEPSARDKTVQELLDRWRPPVLNTTRTSHGLL